MANKRSPKKRRPVPKIVLRVDTATQSMSSLNGTAPEPRLSFRRTVVVRYRMHLESRKLAPGTVNLRLGAVRRLAYEATDCSLTR
jgi:hypothetical protein